MIPIMDGQVVVISTDSTPSPTSDSARRGAPYVDEAEWDRHRALITNLYIGQDKRLTDVMEIMRREYGFDAT